MSARIGAANIEVVGGFDLRKNPAKRLVKALVNRIEFIKKNGMIGKKSGQPPIIQKEGLHRPVADRMARKKAESLAPSRKPLVHTPLQTSSAKGA